MQYQSKATFLKIGLMSLGVMIAVAALVSYSSAALTKQPSLKESTPKERLVVCQMEGQPTLMMKTIDSTLKLTYEGFLSEAAVYNVRDGEMCMLGEAGDFKQAEPYSEPIKPTEEVRSL